MASRKDRAGVEATLLALAAFGAGVAVGLFCVSPKGRALRARIVDDASRGTKWLDRQLEQARTRILAAGDEAADHLRSVVDETVDRVLPEFGSDQEWRDVYTETGKELGRQKR